MWLQILIYFILGVYALHLYLSRNNGFWKKKGLTYVPPKPFIGSLRNPLKLVPLHEWDYTNYKKYGRIFGFFEGSTPQIMVAVPELIQDITIKDFQNFPTRRVLTVADEITLNMVSTIKGERWKKVRAVMSSAFSSGKMRKMSPLINECVETLCANLQEAVDDKRPVDLKRIFGAFSMDVIATVAFGIKLESHRDPNNPFVQHAKKVFSKDSKLIFFFLFAFPTLSRFLGIKFFDEETIDFFKKFTEKMVQARRKNPVQDGKRYDFLQLLLNDVPEVKKMIGKEKEESEVNGAQEQEGLSEVEILSNCVLFFLAGYDTTASALSFLAYNLALNPDCQEKLAKEAETMLRENNNVVDYDTVKKMSYLDAAISESLRLFPPGVRIERECSKDYLLGDTGVTVPKGMLVAIPIYPIHRDAEFFPDPDTFNPDRFLPENREAIKPCTYMPFGSGPRMCLAERLALFEIRLCMTRVISKYRFRLAPETKIPPKIYANLGVLVPHDVILNVERRE